MLDLVELDHVPEIVTRRGKGLIRAVEARGGEALLVPLLAGRFTRLAADARRGVDQLGDGDH